MIMVTKMTMAVIDDNDNDNDDDDDEYDEHDGDDDREKEEEEKEKEGKNFSKFDSITIQCCLLIKKKKVLNKFPKITWCHKILSY